MSRSVDAALSLKVVVASVIWIETLGFLFAALLHTGISIPFLPAFFHDPRIIGATVVEGACGILLGFAAFRVSIGDRAAWATAIGAQVVAIAADFTGMVFIAAGFGPESPFNYLFHRIGIGILLIGLGFLVTPQIRSVLSSRYGQ
jgi:hypothetical protein